MGNSNIRLGLRERCKNNFELRDEKLLKYVYEAVANETEINGKLQARIQQFVERGANSD